MSRAEETIVRSSLGTVVFLVCLGLVVLIPIAAGIGGLASSAGAPAPIPVALAWGFLVACVVRLSRMSLSRDGNELIVRGFFRTVRLQRLDVACISSRYLLPGGKSPPIITVRLRNSTRRTAIAVLSTIAVTRGRRSKNAAAVRRLGKVDEQFELYELV